MPVRSTRRTWLRQVLVAGMLAMALVAVVVTALAGCMGTGAVGDNQAFPPTLCTTDNDCAGRGHCSEGLCLGTSSLTFSAELYPPPYQSNLAPTELTILDITKEGRVTAEFASSVEVVGRVVLAPSTIVSIPATVTFRRPSRIPGAPDYVVSVPAQSSADRDHVGFRARLAPNQDGETYEIIVVPDSAKANRVEGGADLAGDSMPPLHLSLSITSDQKLELPLGDASGLTQVKGRVIDAAGRGVKDMLVRAFGRYQAFSQRELASSAGHTDLEGRFSIWVRSSWEDQFDIEVAPSADQRLPRIVRRTVTIEDASFLSPGPRVLDDMRLPPFTSALSYTLPVVGMSPSGGVVDIDGATVHFKTVLFTEADDLVTYWDRAVVVAGQATLWLIPGNADANRVYSLNIVPMPGSPFAGSWNGVLEVGPQAKGDPSGGVLAKVTLGNSVLLSGRLNDYAANPVEGMAIRCRPSGSYWRNLTDPQRTYAATFAWPEVVTDADGRFAIYLDPRVLGQPTSYDLDLLPPPGSFVPRWSFDQIEPGQLDGASTHDLGNLRMPPASYAKGQIVDPMGAPVANAEIRIYLSRESHDACGDPTAQQQPAPCVTARLSALAQSNASGDLFLVLPNPPQYSTPAVQAPATSP